MKTSKLAVSLLALFFIVSVTWAQLTPNASTNRVTSVKKLYPSVSIAPYGGAIFPLTRLIREDFKPGGLAGIDIGYRINREVGINGKFTYMFMSSKITGAPVGSYMEFSVGPRYYFTHPKLKSALFFEAGAGAYYFRQNSYVNPNDVNGNVIPEIRSTKPGINGGIGASISLSKAVDILAKANYHNVFTPTGSQGFMTINGGLVVTFR